MAFSAVPAAGQNLLQTIGHPDPEDPNDGDFRGLGNTVAGVPDTNGDGRGDLLVGMVRSGRALLYDGATGALLLTLTSPNVENGGRFGSTVAGVPDADGDGRGDLLIGARREEPGSTPEDTGRAYLFSGATGLVLHQFDTPNGVFIEGFGSVAGVPER